MSAKPLVAIVGRPNVGKSTLFNRMIEDRKSIVDSQAGVTRDRVYDEVEWAGKEFSVVDTGGYIPNSKDQIEQATRSQVQVAVEEADLLLFMVNGRNSVTGIDRELSQILRKSDKPILLVVNKCDNAKYEKNKLDFYELGLGDPFPISAINGRNVGDLLDKIVEKLPVLEYDREREKFNMSVVGKPNAGKSSLVNAMLGSEKSIVTEKPGTTRDAIDTDFVYEGTDITLVDTAGLRKRKRVDDGVEFYSVVRANKAIQRCDVAVLVIDAYQGFTKQDANIVNNIFDKNKGLILTYNKWDLIGGDQEVAQNYFDQTTNFYSDLKYYPFLFISALTGRGVEDVLEMGIEVYNKRKKRVPTNNLNEYLRTIIEETPPPSKKGNYIKIKYITQVSTEPPVFEFFTNFPDLIGRDYKKFLERKLRDEFGFNGVPFVMRFKEK